MSLTEAEVVAGRFGRLRLLACDDPAVFWVEAHGFITPGLVRRDLEAAEAFGRRHPWGWTYVADTTGVKVVHPLNLLQLRRIPDLSHLAHYLVLAPRLPIRAAIRLARPIVRPERVFRARRELCAHLDLDA
ncbi:MAG: hypothetical protein O2816_07270 [Planctomycetota bacterium]|nr:hypothetical protein [Planctomycetota bacterium]